MSNIYHILIDQSLAGLSRPVPVSEIHLWSRKESTSFTPEACLCVPQLASRLNCSTGVLSLYTVKYTDNATNQCNEKGVLDPGLAVDH